MSIQTETHKENSTLKSLFEQAKALQSANEQAKVEDQKYIAEHPDQAPGTRTQEINKKILGS